MSNANYDKLNFGRTINEYGKHGFITSDRCLHYGSIDGCDEHCPVLVEGLCKNEDSIRMYEGKINE